MTKIFSEISLVFQCHNQSPEHTQRSDRDQAQDELRGGEGRTTSKYGLSSAIFDYSLFDHLIHFSKRRCCGSKASAKPHTMVISTFLNDFSSTAKVRRYLIWVEGLFIFLFFFPGVQRSTQFDCACIKGHIVRMLLKKSQLNCNFPRWRISADSNQSSIIQWVGASLCVLVQSILVFK